MRIRDWMTSFLAGAVLVAFPAVARAQASLEEHNEMIEKGKVPAAAPVRPASDFPFFVGVSGGAGFATLSHPQITKLDSTTPTTVSFVSPALNLHAGYSLGEHVTLGLEFTAMETSVGRQSGGDLFKLGYTPKAACTSCHGPAVGADVLQSPLVFSTAAARAEYAPFGRDGLFIGAGVGVASLIGLGDDVGLGVSGRLGYRLRPASAFTVSLEAGVQGQIYGDASLYMPYGALAFRPYF